MSLFDAPTSAMVLEELRISKMVASDDVDDILPPLVVENAIDRKGRKKRICLSPEINQIG